MKKNLAFGIAGITPILTLAIWGWGDVRSFFSHPARAGAVCLAIAGTIAYSISGSSGLKTGWREDSSSRWLFAPLIIAAMLFAWLPPHLDRRDSWTIDGDVCRYLGLGLTAIGGYVRVATIFELGHRFSIFVALQSNHELKTDGFYALVRHPSYLGGLVCMIGWALVFRSVVGLLLIAAIMPLIVIRISAEENFLATAFGEQFRSYQQRTRWRLMPFVY